ncbi:MAG: flavodoxin family protein [Synergistaceae bacterium]
MTKVLLINGSPHEKGCVYTALSEIVDTLTKENIETEIFQLGTSPIRGCIACKKCYEIGKCIFNDDKCNELANEIAESDAIVIGSPVYYAGANGALCALLDRTFYSSGKRFAGKLGASIASCRRGGASATFDRLNKYFTISNMPIVSSQYWNSVHGNTPDEVKQDFEGLQTMRTLAKNMAWLLKNIEKAEIPKPEIEKKIATNYIR